MDAVDRRIVAVLERVGGSVSERELRYQLSRDDATVPDDLIDRLADLEGGGMVASELSFSCSRVGARAIDAPRAESLRDAA
jgi:hypothetical protein